MWDALHAGAVLTAIGWAKLVDRTRRLVLACVAATALLVARDAYTQVGGKIPKSLAANMQACTGDSQCDPTGIACAQQKVTGVCRGGYCVFNLDTSNTSCDCVAGAVKSCMLGCPAAPGNCNTGYMQCVAVSGSTTAAHWDTNNCVKSDGCPANGAVVACDTGNPACQHGKQTFSCTTGWSACICDPCGSDGKRCCDGGACGSDLICGSDNLCHPCGLAVGQPCCGDGSCRSPLTCGEGSRCVANDLLYCVDNDGDGFCTRQCVRATVGAAGPGWRSDCQGVKEDDRCDAWANVNPGQNEICDDLDNNCDGRCNENDVCGSPFLENYHAEYRPDQNGWLQGTRINIDRGGPCGARFTKGEAWARKTNGSPPDHSNCSAEWRHPNDPNDCSYHLHFGAKAGAWIECDVRVTRKLLPCRF